MKYSEFKPFVGKIVNEKTSYIKLPYLESTLCIQKTLYDKNGYKHIIKYDADTNDVYEILTLDFLNQRVCINNNPSIMKYNAKTKNLMTINYGDEKDNLPSKINWFPNGNYKSITFTKGGTLHRTNGPAEIIFSQDGSCTKKYYINGKEITDELQITLLDLEDVYNTNYYEMRKQNN